MSLEKENKPKLGLDEYLFYAFLAFVLIGLPVLSVLIFKKYA
jgi:hypothetical protein